MSLSMEEAESRWVEVDEVEEAIEEAVEEQEEEVEEEEEEEDCDCESADLTRGCCSPYNCCNKTCRGAGVKLSFKNMGLGLPATATCRYHLTFVRQEDDDDEEEEEEGEVVVDEEVDGEIDEEDMTR